jgi:antitoxin ParD1/3/4
VEVGDLSRRTIKPDRARIELFSHHGGSQQGRKSGPQAAVGLAPFATDAVAGGVTSAGAAAIRPHRRRHQGREKFLTPDLENAIRRRLDCGAYKSDVDVIRAGLRALDRDDEEKAHRLAQLDASIAHGIADADAGRVHPADQVFGELRQRIQRKADTRGR